MFLGGLFFPGSHTIWPCDRFLLLHIFPQYSLFLGNM